MLDLIRNKSQSIGVKLAFGLIIVVFVFWGFGSIQSINNSTTIATVNNEAITIVDFERMYQYLQQAAIAQNPEITPEQLRLAQLPQQTLNGLIFQTLTDEEIKRLHLSISNNTLRDYIVSNPMFKNEQDVFDPEKYKRVADQRFEGVANYESNVREGMLEEKLRRSLTATAQSYDSDVQAFFAYANEKRNVDYIFFPMDDALAELGEPAKDSVKAFYESNKANFTLPATVNVEYVSVSPVLLGKPESIDAQAVKAYYDKNVADKYTIPKQVRASHILLRLAPNADEAEVKKVTETLEGLKKELTDGADFAELAKKHSQDTDSAEEGGELGWVSENRGLQSFNEAIFALEVGEVSDIVRTPIGLHLLKSNEFKDGSVQELSAVESEIRDALAAEAGLLKIREALDALIEANVLGSNLADVAKSHALELKSSEHKTASELAELLVITPENAEKIVALSAGVPLDTPMQTTDNGYIIAKVAEKKEASVRPFAEVEAEIIKILKEKSALEKALTTASTARKSFETKAPEESSIKNIEDVKRFGEIGPFGLQAQMSMALFAAKKGEWLPVAYAVSVDGKQGSALVRVNSITSIDENEMKPLEYEYRMGELHKRQEKMYNLFRDALYVRGQVDIVNQDFINALNQR